MRLQDISDILCEKLVENKQDGRCYSAAACIGVNNVDGKRVHLSIVLSESMLDLEDIQ